MRNLTESAKALRDLLSERILVLDGAMGTMLQQRQLSAQDFGGVALEGCNENLLVTRPDAVEKVHAGFLEVGCDVVETNSFNGTPVDFAEYDIGDKAYDMNVMAARLARRVASDFSTPAKPRWVAGSMLVWIRLPGEHRARLASVGSRPSSAQWFCSCGSGLSPHHAKAGRVGEPVVARPKKLN